MALNGATLARERLRKIRTADKATKTVPRRVNFHVNGSDFQVAMLFNIGMESQAIAEHVGLTKSQVEYRLRKMEWEQRSKAKREGKTFLSARRQYRKGISPVNRMVVSIITGHHSQVKKFVAGVLDKRGLFAPKASGVLKTEK